MIAWCRARSCPVTLCDRMWRLYAQPASLFGIGVMSLSPSQMNQLNTTQRMADRAILGFSTRSPTPSIILELGWHTWGCTYDVEVVRLLSRAYHAINIIVDAIFEDSADNPKSWLHKAVVIASPWAPDQACLTRRQWKEITKQMIESKAEAVFRELLLDAEHHHNLRSYTPAWNQQAGLPGINLTLHKNRVPVLKAQRIGRLLVGGQCLNGGDPAEPPDVAEANACPFCADGGAMVVETLRHAIFECYAYNGYRRHVSALLSSRPNDITTLCRGEWSWKELRALINFFGEVAHKRELVNKKNRG